MFVIVPQDLSPRPPLAAVGEVSAVTAGRRHRVFQTELARAITDLGLGTGVITTPAPRPAADG